ncbi:Two-component sensor histidine kinase, contains HisKA and HATPase domains [Altererythrobacter xiamenensis]|uniref:histidine kinase n=1 Tax=Altererythrobacter xiamenensis TaxID=1316679 RepID=A0A1Y6FK94_9SPHN|nr:HWE histidine kinase domain-containing protein [Altererythrobacter xiamenensis]SMQ74776.1 Two-component sensor histidine kinase, contains HisKA and HATPase domains [Altererythrobacter xiamenensis]
MPERLNRLEAILSGQRWDFAFRLHSYLPQRKSVWAALIALALLGGATVLKFAVDDVAGGRLPPFIFLYPAVVLAALIVGARRGLLITLLSILIAWLWFLPPHSSFTIEAPTGLLSLEIYGVSALFLTLTVGFARHALDLAIASEELRDYDAQEAIHRIKNLIAVVQSIAMGTMNDTNDLEEYRELLSKRLGALATAQDVLRKRGEVAATVEDLAQAALNPFLPNPRISIECHDSVTVPARYVHGLTLALFELATNSSKYGVLAQQYGAISLTCEKREAEVLLKWEESTARGSELSTDEPDSGFGCRLIQVALRNDQGTSVTHESDDHGVRATFIWRCAKNI